MKQYRNFTLLALVLIVALNATNANAMPMFARKLGIPCQTCHTTIPALNETGYKFRAAGFRLPEMIGKSDEKKFELGDYFSARAQARYDSQVTNQPNGAPSANTLATTGGPGSRTTTNAFSFQEFTLYPLTGSWGKYYGSLAELSVSPEDFFEVENAYVRFSFGNSKRFFTSRVGIFHPWEGFGASDRPYSNGRTLFQSKVISSKATAIPFLYQPWGLDEAGIEIGGDYKKLSVRAAVLGGTFMRWDPDANAFLAFPAQTGPWKGANQAVAALGKPFNSAAHNTPDFSANATYILHPNGGAISLLYYHGNISTPSGCTRSDGTFLAFNATDTDVSATDPVLKGKCGGEFTDFVNGVYRNNFDRVGLYASYPIGKHFLPMGGFLWGRDTNCVALPCSGAGFTSTNLKNIDVRGAFADGVVSINQYLTTGLRYDWFGRGVPETSSLANTQWAITPYVNIPLQNGFQIIAEYQHRDFQYFKTGTVPGSGINNRQDDTFQARVIFIK